MLPGTQDGVIGGCTRRDDSRELPLHELCRSTHFASAFVLSLWRIRVCHRLDLLANCNLVPCLQKLCDVTISSVYRHSTHWNRRPKVLAPLRQGYP